MQLIVQIVQVMPIVARMWLTHRSGDLLLENKGVSLDGSLTVHARRPDGTGVAMGGLHPDLGPERTAAAARSALAILALGVLYGATEPEVPEPGRASVTLVQPGDDGGRAVPDWFPGQTWFKILG